VLKAFDIECPEHGKRIALAETTSQLMCPEVGCLEKVDWIPSFARVRGAGWFRPGYDVALGGYYESMEERDRLMKARGAVEADGGADVGCRPSRKDAVQAGDVDPLPLPGHGRGEIGLIGKQKKN
jgi:hypothetical protein